MNKIIYMTMALCGIMLTAGCSSEAGIQNDADSKVLSVTVGSYPAFTEQATTRNAIPYQGNADAGKTAWAAGDRILLKVQFGSSPASYYTLTLGTDGTTWTPSSAIYSLSGGATITAYYAPDFEWSNGALSLISGKTAGLNECIKYQRTVAATDADYAAGTVSLDFSDATCTTRDYSRLRIAYMPNTNITFEAGNFTPAGTTTAVTDYKQTLTTDDNGNAFLYGSWTGTSSAANNIKVLPPSDITYTYNSKDYTITELYNKSIESGNTTGTAYSIAAYIPCYYPTGGTVPLGSASDPYVIFHPSQLISLAGEVNRSSSFYSPKYYVLNNDIDLGGIEWTPIGYGSSIISSSISTYPFKGSFDGGGHTISNFKLTKAPYTRGLFGYTDRASIKNLNITKVNADYTTYSDDNLLIGILAGQAEDDYFINNCHVSDCTITTSLKSHAGGLIGYANGSTIIRSSADVTITAKPQTDGQKIIIGGLVGFGDNPVIGACYSAGKIEWTGTNGKSLVWPSLFGNFISPATILCCYSSMTITDFDSGQPAAIHYGDTEGNTYKLQYSAITQDYPLATKRTGSDNITLTLTGSSKGVAAGSIYSIVTNSNSTETITAGSTVYTVKDCWTDNTGTYPTIK